MSQLVLTESAATCMANQLAQSDIGKINLNSARWDQFFMVDGFKLDSSSISNHIKLFKEKIGENIGLKIDFSFKDIQVYFGQFDVDMAVDYTMCMKFRMDLLGARELMYDCLEFTTSANIRSESEILHIDIIENKLVLDSRGGNRDMPKRNSMDMTSNEYREFLEDVSFTTSEIKKWLNDVVLRGDNILFPYAMDEFETYLKFESQKMHVMIDIEDKAYKYLEDHFWEDRQ